MSEVTCTPDPPVCGAMATFCIVPARDTIITVTFEPNGPQVELPVSKDGGCASTMVPDDAMSCEATAPGATAYTSPCEEP